MFSLDVRKILIVVAVLAAIVGLCVLNLRCSGEPGTGASVTRVRDELRAGRRERRIQEADNLAVLARDMRVMAQRYREQGETKKAHRAIGAAQELDKRIRALREGE